MAPTSPPATAALAEQIESRGGCIAPWLRRRGLHRRRRSLTPSTRWPPAGMETDHEHPDLRRSDHHPHRRPGMFPTVPDEVGLDAYAVLTDDSGSWILTTAESAGRWTCPRWKTRARPIRRRRVASSGRRSPQPSMSSATATTRSTTAAALCAREGVDDRAGLTRRPRSCRSTGRQCRGRREPRYQPPPEPIPDGQIISETAAVQPRGSSYARHDYGYRCATENLPGARAQTGGALVKRNRPHVARAMISHLRGPWHARSYAVRRRHRILRGPPKAAAMGANLSTGCGQKLTTDRRRPALHLGRAGLTIVITRPRRIRGPGLAGIAGAT